MKKKKLFFVIIILLFLLYVRNVLELVISNIDKVNNTYDSYSYESIKKQLKSSKNKVIVIDPGHGGNDPGKIGINGCLEKEINLAISNELKEELLKSGFDVIMTRTIDKGLYNDMDSNKKMNDLINRVNIVNNSDAVAVVSIHQNAYISESEKGAQVFYYEGSDIGFQLAKSIQDSMRKCLDIENKRIEKANTSYFMLKKTIRPTVIVECGFLSNNVEANKLIKKGYQKKVARSIKEGIENWTDNILKSVY